MSAFSFARQAFGREKPHSSITDWVDILTSSGVEEEAYDGIPELVDSINLQAAGPTEASRAIRKKLKHGNPHQQYRSLVLLKALVENCGHKFQTTFADGQLTDALKHIASDPNADKRVKKKLLLVLASWRDQFKSDSSMTLIAGLYKQCRGEGHRLSQQELAHLVGLPSDQATNIRAEKEEAKRKAKQEKDEAKQRSKREGHARGSGGGRSAPFEFEKDKPKVLASIVDASQASSNLVNAITLVNPETDSVQHNERVQECLAKAKQVRKPIVRYIQLVENEELIGTLIETNERIIAALELYDSVSSQHAGPTMNAITPGLAATYIHHEGETNNTSQRQHLAADNVKQIESTGGQNRDNGASVHLHPDLQDLNFGPLGASSTNLPPPLRPSTLSDDGNDRDEHAYEGRGSLSDFSDYDSSDEDVIGPSKRRGRRNYVDVSDGPDDQPSIPIVEKVAQEIDPFADPFADDISPGRHRK